MTDRLVSVAIPAVLEGSHLYETAATLIESAPLSVEVIISLNGADRDTAAAARRAANDFAQVTVIERLHRIGKGAAIMAALKEARGGVLGFVDANGPFNPADIWALAQLVVDGDCDCAIASKWFGHRYTEVKSYSIPLRKILSRAFNVVVRRGFNLNFADTQGGCKFFTRSAFATIPDRLICIGYDFDVELLWRIQAAGYRISERYLPSRTNHSQSMFGLRMMQMLIELVRLRRLKTEIHRPRP